ncbi:hypothetical protein ACLMJK_000349 [Lecanora helva]
MASTAEIEFASDEHRRYYIVMMDQYVVAYGTHPVIISTLTFEIEEKSQARMGTLPSTRWNQVQVNAWREQSKAPTKLCQLQRDNVLVTLVFIPSRLRRWPDGDVIITPAIFERLEATPTATAILTSVTEDHCALFPREAIGFDDAKRAVYRNDRTRDEDWTTLSDCLQVGFRLRDMFVRADGRLGMPGQVHRRGHTAGDLSDAHPGF